MTDNEFCEVIFNCKGVCHVYNDPVYRGRDCGPNECPIFMDRCTANSAYEKSEQWLVAHYKDGK